MYICCERMRSFIELKLHRIILRESQIATVWKLSLRHKQGTIVAE
jgi:hypothetical protein